MAKAVHAPNLATSATLGEGARAILNDAVRLFAEKGFDAISMNDIANAAGVSKANIFHHFSNKETLYLEVLRKACEVTTQNIQELHFAFLRRMYLATVFTNLSLFCQMHRRRVR